MRYTEFLIEGDKKVDSVLKLIQRDCQPYLKAVGNKPEQFPLYRGAFPGAPAGKKRTALKSRRPMNTERRNHDAMNKHFIDNYGHPFRNGLFVSGNENEAAQYGETMKIFPIGEFEFLWHPQINDIFLQLNDGLNPGPLVQQYRKANGLPPAASHTTQVPPVVDPITGESNYQAPVRAREQIKKEIEASSVNMIDILEWLPPFQTTNLKKAISSNKEIMIWAPSYYYVKV